MSKKKKRKINMNMNSRSNRNMEYDRLEIASELGINSGVNNNKCGCKCNKNNKRSCK